MVFHLELHTEENRVKNYRVLIGHAIQPLFSKTNRKALNYFQILTVMDNEQFTDNVTIIFDAATNNISWKRNSRVVICLINEIVL